MKSVTNITKTTLLILIIVLSVIQAIGQTLTCKVIEANTKTPIEFAHISLERSKVGAVSKQNGEATISLPKSYLEHDKLHCSFVGCKDTTFTLQISDFVKNNQAVVISLSFAFQQIQMVEVSDKSSDLTGQEIIKKALKNVKKNYPRETTLLECFYREKSYENENLVELNETVAAVEYSKYPQRNYVRKAFRTYWRDMLPSPTISRYKKIIIGGNPQYFDYFVGKDDECRIVATRISEIYSSEEFIILTNAGPLALLALLALDKVKYQADFFDKRLIKKYGYKKTGAVMINNVPCYIIKFFPKNNDKRVFQSLNKKMKFPIYSGNIYVSIDDFSIVKFECQFAEQIPVDIYQDKLGIGEQFPKSSKVSVTYEKSKNGKWLLDEVQTSIVIQPTAVTRFKNTYQSDRYLKVVDFLEEVDASKPIMKNAFRVNNRRFPLSYDATFWEQYETTKKYPQLTTREKQQMEKYKPLGNQFASWFEYHSMQMPEVEEKMDSFKIINQFFRDDLSWIENISDTLVRTAVLKENTYLSNQFQPFEVERRAAYKAYNQIGEFCEDKDEIYSYKRGISPKGEYGVLEYKKDKFSRLLFSYDKELSKNEKLITYEMNPNKDYLLLRMRNNNEEQLYWKRIGTAERYKITDASLFDLCWLDNTTLIFSEENNIYREFKVSQYDIKTKVLKTIFESTDSTKEVEITGFTNEVFISHGDHSTNELFVFDGKTLKKVHDNKSIRSIFYGIDNDYFYVSGYIKGEKQGIYRKSKTGNDWELVIKGNDQQYVDDFIVTKDYLLIKVFERGEVRLLRYSKANKTITTIQLPNNLCSIDFYVKSDTKAFDYQSNEVQFYYSTINIADRLYTLNLNTKALSFKQEFCLTNETSSFVSEVLNIPTTHTDSVLLRITYPDRDKTHKGLILNVYGAYSAFQEAAFNEFDYFLLQQGYAIAYAHVRGSRVLGYEWYNDGKLLNKQNGITDYLTCVNYLKEKGYTDKIIAYGQSAGGVIVGAALNQNPTIFDGAILDYPYLGMLKVMVDSELPLTVTEYSEFGNINEAETLDDVIKFAPYHNITKQDYPPVLLFAGTKDNQTPYWQTMKYGLKLRTTDTKDPERILLSISNTGHAGGGNFLERKNQYMFMYLFLEKFCE